MKKKTTQPAKSKLTLDDFKEKSKLNGSNESLEAITGGILGACHDQPAPRRAATDGDMEPPKNY